MTFRMQKINKNQSVFRHILPQTSSPYNKLKIKKIGKERKTTIENLQKNREKRSK